MKNNFNITNPKLRSEQDIISQWNDSSIIPLVSILCTTFNQERYIENTLIGFLSQITKFPFEIVIHDDASTDGTAEIIDKYKKLFPNLIKPIFQKENKYSKGIEIITTYLIPNARGTYFAFCEGDDFWIDENKLEKQITAIKDHPNINICFSSGLSLYRDGTVKEFCKHKDKIHIFSVEEVIEGDGAFMPTCSLVIHKKVFNNLPIWFKTIAPVGDYFLQILGSLHKGALYIPDCTCIYRVNAIGSWSVRSKSLDADLYYHKINRLIYCLKQIDVSTQYRYTDSISNMCSLFYLNAATIYIDEKNYDQANKLILKSWKEKTNLSHKQVILKRFSKLSPLFRKYRVLKKYIT